MIIAGNSPNRSIRHRHTGQWSDIRHAGRWSDIVTPVNGPTFVIPMNGSDIRHTGENRYPVRAWIPAYAGMTKRRHPGESRDPDKAKW
jgi:hypothetical protein